PSVEAAATPPGQEGSLGVSNRVFHLFRLFQLFHVFQLFHTFLCFRRVSRAFFCCQKRNRRIRSRFGHSASSEDREHHRGGDGVIQHGHRLEFFGRHQEQNPACNARRGNNGINERRRV